MPCKERARNAKVQFWLYRPCTASFDVGSLKRGDLAILRTKRKDDLEPYWQDERDWLCTVEFLPTDDPEARMFASDIIGYLFGYAHLTNTRSLALVGDPDANAYELLFSFSSSEEKKQFLELVRSVRTWETTTSKTICCRPQLKRSGMLVHSRWSHPRMFLTVPC